jgi:hypothetical protein
MLHRTWRFAALPLLGLLLAGCNITVTPNPPITITGELVAEVYDPLGGGSPDVQESGQIAGNETLYFELSVPSARDLLFVEAEGSDLRIRLLTEGGSTLAVSNSSRYFAASTADLSALGEVEPGNISTNFFCVGPCVAVRPQTDGYLVALRNLSGTPRSYDLSAYTMDATDLNEPNGSSGSAVGFGSGDAVSGAIEWLGDEDWFRYDGASVRQLSLRVYDLAPGVALQFQSDGVVVRGTLAGATVEVRPGDVFRVFSQDGRAGPSASSRYSITTTAP